MPTEHNNRTCRTCKRVKPITEYAFTGSHNRRSVCKPCVNERQITNKKRRHKAAPPPRHAPLSGDLDLNSVLRWGYPTRRRQHGATTK